MTNRSFYNFKLGGATGDCTTDVFSMTAPGVNVIKPFCHCGANKARIFKVQVN
jgi:hypothetical protein